LGVLDDLGSFSYFDRGRFVDARGNDRTVYLSDEFEGLAVLTRDDLEDSFESVLFVSRVDPLGGVPQFKVDALLKAAALRKDRPTDLLGYPRIHR